MDFKSHPASLNTVSASINATADRISDAILLVQSTMTYGAICAASWISSAACSFS